uniref:Uncharacterized protein n=1 Tax=uncultured prokaryote TaxID=198431 RepID=A0A0H5PXB5_9ZZZZ|nr:hypothetical protein [uncultured prokaryote]
MKTRIRRRLSDYTPMIIHQGQPQTTHYTLFQTTMSRILILTISILFALSSCESSKDFVYLQDMHVGERYHSERKHEATVHCDDRLSITVSCKQPELALPFNAKNTAVSVTAGGEVSASEKPTIDKGYRVDVDGNIDFPMLGKLHVEGKTLAEVTQMVRNGIVEGNYIKAPLVDVDFLNFKYTVLGAVGKNGTFNIDGDRVTLLEAIAQAGDLAPNARVDRVTVVRENGNERQVYLHDLRSSDIFNSPCFYLQQNDIVYVEPKYRRKERVDRVSQYLSLAISIASVASITITCAGAGNFRRFRADRVVICLSSPTILGRCACILRMVAPRCRKGSPNSPFLSFF